MKSNSIPHVYGWAGQNLGRAARVQEEHFKKWTAFRPVSFGRSQSLERTKCEHDTLKYRSPQLERDRDLYSMKSTSSCRARRDISLEESAAEAQA